MLVRAGASSISDTETSHISSRHRWKELHTSKEKAIQCSADCRRFIKNTNSSFLLHFPHLFQFYTNSCNTITHTNTPANTLTNTKLKREDRKQREQSSALFSSTSWDGWQHTERSVGLGDSPLISSSSSWPGWLRHNSLRSITFYNTKRGTEQLLVGEYIPIR